MPHKKRERKKKKMKFDELDEKLRIFETSHDYCVIPGIYMIARLDGRNFTRLTKEILKFKAPFDEKFRDLMIETTKHLMGKKGTAQKNQKNATATVP
jgi:tRNA(His) 5'-end guanylyltransferase